MADQHSLRRKTYLTLNNELQPNKFRNFINFLLIALIVTNVIAVVLESEAQIGAMYQTEFWWFETISVAIFTIEYVLRVWCSVEHKGKKSRSTLSRRIRYMLTPMAIIDLLAILPYFLGLFFQLDLRTLRLFRIFRILKLSHYFAGFNIFVTVIKKELRSILAAGLVVFFLITIAASLMYTVEGTVQPDKFGSILKAYWWSVVTMTTVGYGDVVPITPLGKTISVIIMLMGIGVVALPAGLLAARFGDELRERRRNLDVHIQQALADGKITAEEYQDLQTLAVKLELKPDDLNQGIKLQKKQRRHPIEKPRCPHCHKELS